MFEIYAFGQMVLAIILGGVLGWQREYSGKTVGPRTYALIAAGSTLFTIISIYAFSGDTARIAAGIVTGIGFLGVGTILHRENKVEGLTTATGIWITAAIGMAVGVGFYTLAILSTAIIFLVLMMHDDWFRKSPPSQQ